MGPYQNETGSDGIGDKAYVIDENNVDRYPLMNSWTPPDIAVINVTPSETVIGRGLALLINVTALNQGSKIESVNITTYVNATFIQTKTATLTNGNSITVTFMWNTTEFAKGIYTLWAYAWPLPSETDIADNTKTADRAVTLTVPSHDVAILGVASKTIVGQGYPLTINVTIVNFGNFTENFNVTVYANMISIASQRITLKSGNCTSIIYRWDTTTFPKGNYTIKAIADAVLNETDTSDNTFTDGVVYVGVPGDVDGNNFVEVKDILAVALAYGSYPGERRYNANFDINGDDFIDIRDILIAALNYG
jgi:hypothetical protein